MLRHSEMLVTRHSQCSPLGVDRLGQRAEKWDCAITEIKTLKKFEHIYIYILLTRVREDTEVIGKTEKIICITTTLLLLLLLTVTAETNSRSSTR